MEQTVGKRLKEYTATAINTGSEVYKKIMATDDPLNPGAIEAQLNTLFAFLEAYREPDIFEQKGKHQFKSFNFFSGLKKAKQESLYNLKYKYQAMMIRNKEYLDTVWGTKHNIEHALRYFFAHENCFVMEYTNDKKTNLLSDSFTSDRWMLNNIALDKKPEDLTPDEEALLNTLFTEEAALINVKAIALKANNRLKTRRPVVIKRGLYTFHFFMRGQHTTGTAPDFTRSGSVEVTIGNVLHKTYSVQGEWVNIHEDIYFEKDGEYDFLFSCVHDVDIDFICLFPSLPYPTMSILIGNGGAMGAGSMFFGPGRQDVLIDGSGAVIQYFEPPYRGTHSKYKFWFPNGDDTEREAKQERAKNKLKFDDHWWGYWSDEMRWFDAAYLTILLDALIPVGVKVFDIVMSRRGS